MNLEIPNHATQKLHIVEVVDLKSQMLFSIKRVGPRNRHEIIEDAFNGDASHRQAGFCRTPPDMRCPEEIRQCHEF